MQKRLLKKDNLVVQSNALIEASYSMTSNEIKIFTACVSQIDSRKKIEAGDDEFTLKVDDVIDLFYTETNRMHVYRDLRSVAERLFERKALIKLEPGVEVLTRFVQSIKFDENNREIVIRFAREIIPFISQLESHFTQFRIQYISHLSSNYSHRLYHCLVEWIGLGKNFMEIEIDILRSRIAEGKYKNNKDFRVRVLDVALSEINTHSDLWVEMLLLKRRRAFERVQFKFGRKQGIAKEEEKRKIEAKEKTERNAVAKKARLQKEQIEVTNQDNKKVLEEYRKHPEGTIFSDTKGKKYFKTSSGILMGEDGGAILEQDAAALIKKGVLAGAFS